MIGFGIVSLLAGCLAVAPQDNWPQFRGADSLGSSEAEGLPTEWSAGKNVTWKVEIPGRGWSSPIVWGDKIFVTTAVSAGKEEAPKKGLYFGGERLKPSANRHSWRVYCIDFKTGDVLWQREVQSGLPRSSLHIKNSAASETPCTDGKRVYAYFGNLGLYAFDLDGKLEWTRKWKPVRTRYGWGTAASPIVKGDRVYIINDNEEQSFLEALDSKTGKTAWRVDRKEKSNWATPFLWKNKLRSELVTAGTGGVRSYSLEGKLLWKMGGMSVITIPTPFADSEFVYITSGYVMDRKRPMVAVRPGGSGKIEFAAGESRDKSIGWFQPRSGPYNPTPVLYKGIIYVLYDRGFLAAYDARTGKEIYGRERLRDGAAAFTVSPWAYGDRIFCLSEDGETFVIQAGREYKLLRTNDIGEMSMATPAMANGSLILRSTRHLYRIDSP